LFPSFFFFFFFFWLTHLSTSTTTDLVSCRNTARTACFKVLSKLKVGHVKIITASPSNPSVILSVNEFGDVKSTQKATLTVLKESFWPRLALYSVMGFGEGYMYGEINVDSLAMLLTIFVQNRSHLSDMNVLPAGLNKMINAVVYSHIPNTIYNSLYNIQAHYDLGNDMFASFLDPTMTYSCPIWADENDDDLEAAQYRKIHALLERACIKKGQHVLEIGTGWGALSIEAVKLYQCKVTTLTLSAEQKALAEQRIAAAGLSESIEVLLCDYRSLDPQKHQFDRIVTCEMLEAVGPEFLPVFFKQAHNLLKPNGVLSLQVITMPDARYENYLTKVDFIQKHIFPGGHCPSVTALTDAIYKGAQGKLIVDELVNIGPHYAKALRVWREKFIENFDDVAKKASGDMQKVYTEEFKRKWEFYFAYCEVGFASRTLGDIQMRLTREGNAELLDGIPF
jgi:cyclopropane-fatty-acyl-phospholipid synthase